MATDLDGEIYCEKHGPDCTYSLDLHPLPSQGRESTAKGPYPDWDADGADEDPVRFTTRG